jgi:CRP-like cAMP-binding protein
MSTWPNRTNHKAMTDDEAHRTLLDATDWFSIECPPGATLVTQGEVSSTVHLVNDGVVKLVRNESEGFGGVFSLRSKGSLIGATGAILACGHLFTATSLTRVRLAAIPKSLFLDLLLREPQFGLAVSHCQARDAENELLYLSGMQRSSAQERLQHAFGHLMGLGLGDEARPLMRAPLKHYELAQLIQVTPVHLSRVLTTMEQEGLISRSKGSIFVDRRRIARTQTTIPAPISIQ